MDSENYKVKAEDVKALIDIYNKVYEVVGKDTLGVFLYNQLQKADFKENEKLAYFQYLKSLTVEDFIIESRLLMTVLSSLVNSISEDDINTILEIVNSEVPTSTQITKVFAILADSVGAIKVTDDVWTEYYEYQAGMIERLFANAELKKVLDEATGSSANTEKMKASIVTLVKDMGQYVPTSLSFVQNLLLGVDEDLVNKVMVIVTMGGEGISDLIPEITGLVYNAYDKLTAEEKVTFEKMFNSTLTMVNDNAKLVVEEKLGKAAADLAILNIPKDENVTFANLMTMLKDGNMSDLATKGLGYVGARAPYVMILLTVSGE